MQARISLSDNFSWRRVWNVALFYGPAISKQLLIYAAATVVFFCLTLMPFNASAQVALFSMIWAAIGFMVEFAPIVLAKSGDSRIIERLLPATAAEKLTFFSIYFLLVVPFVCYLLPHMSLYVYNSIPAIQTDAMLALIDIKHSNPPQIMVMNLLSTAAAIITCLYMVLFSKSNRIIKGILSVFAVNIGLGVLGAIYGMGAMFRLGYEQGVSGEQPDVKEIINSMSQSTGYLVVVTVIIALFAAYMFWITYKKLKGSWR